jgi:hypothetical protein
MAAVLRWKSGSALLRGHSVGMYALIAFAFRFQQSKKASSGMAAIFIARLQFLLLARQAATDRDAEH